MNMKFRRLKAAAVSLAMAVGFVPSVIGTAPVSAAYGTGNNIVEYLDRGISAINTGSGMHVSWRYLATDSDNAVFRLYRDNTLIYTSEAGMGTSFIDTAGNGSSVYTVEAVENGVVTSKDTCSMIANQSYFEIPLDIPAAGTDYTYSANDCSVGDVDGDGQYELFVKWDPSNSQDNSFDGVTGNVYIDCYTLEGTKLWRIDLGKNIRAGAHYTQYLVADFDCDGKAEMTCKTADGTVDGKGTVIGDASADYRNSSGRILSGPEYYTLFDGATGAALDTVDYEHPRGEVSKWGDNYGNRCDRFVGAVAYLDGVHPSAVTSRGYYTRFTAVAYDVVNKKLVKRWAYDTGYDSSKDGYADGNHNCMPADVDGDGKQEIVFGAVCLDDNGTVLWCNNLGHGDAMHMSDFLPDRAGLELWVCHEHEPWGVSLLDAKTGEKIFHYDHSKDTGRCAAGNIYAGNPGAEFWGAQSGSVYDGTGTATDIARPAQNFLIYWDGDLERELLDGNTITKINASKKIDTVLVADGCTSNNSTKATPNLSADILGDWREELLLKTEDSKYMRIYSTPYATESRITTLMHDTQYRMQVATEQTGYNQPPHTSFYLGSDEALPERPAVTIQGANIDSRNYAIRNKNSGLYLSIEGEAKISANVSQNAIAVSDVSVWNFHRSTDGYYTVSSAKYPDLFLDLTGGKTAAGTNIGVYREMGNAAQLFGLVDNGDGSYLLTTKATNGASCIEVKDASADVNANIQQWEKNGHACQSWILEPVVIGEKVSDNVIVGDVNRDGKVNCFDFVLIKRNKDNINGFDRQFADTNADGFVTREDINALGKFLTKQGSFEAVDKKAALYYADEMSFTQGVTENVNAGFKKDKYVNLDNCTGSRLEWNISVPEDGNYLCSFNIANGSTDNRKMKIEVNDNADYWMQDFLSTESWTSWTTRGIVLPLKKGINSIRMISETASGGPNIDYLYFEKTDEPIAEVYVPEQIPTVPEPQTRTIYIAGDSTVQTYRESYAPQQGWGAHLAENLTGDVAVSNHAIAGRSSKSFYDNGRLDTILESIKEGDMLLVQFGINDSASSIAERYAPVSGTVPGAEYSFEWYLAKYIEGAKAKGATPVLVTTVLGLKAYNSSTGKFSGSYENYCSAMKQLAAYYNIPCIDLNSLMVDHYNSIGYDTAYTYHMISTGNGSTDMTHFTETGAKAVAKLVADALKEQKLV